MTIRDRLEFKKLQDENSALKKRLVAADKSMTRTLAQLDSARRAKFGPIPKVRARVKLRGDKIALFCCDLHGAKMEKPAVAALLADVRRLQPHVIYLLGDIVDCGGFLASHHVMGYVAETLYTYDDDILAANTFLDALRKAAPNALIEFVEGNHEQRVERWCVTTALKGGNPRDAEGLRLRNAPEFLLRLKEREIAYFRMSETYDGLSVRGTIKRGKMFLTHGSFLVGKDAARKAVEKFSGNVAFGNTHRADTYVGHRPNVGVVGGFNPGCLCEKRPLYMNTNPDDWTHGYATQFITHTDTFLHINVPLIDGSSLLGPMLDGTNQKVA